MKLFDLLMNASILNIKKILLLVLTLVIHVQLKSEGIKTFMFPEFNNLSLIANADRTTALYTYYESYLDTFGNVLKTLHLNSTAKNLAIMQGNSEVSFTMSLNSYSIDLKNLIKVSGRYKSSQNASGVWFKRPTEAWLKEETNFTINNTAWKSEASFTTKKINNLFEKYCIQVKFYKGKKWQYTLTFGSKVGLVSYSDYLGNKLENTMEHDAKAALIKMKYDNAESMRKAFIEKYFEFEKRAADTSDILNEMALRHFVYYRSLDTLAAMAKGLCEFNNNYQPLCRSLMLTILANECKRLGEKQNRSLAINEYLTNYSTWALYLVPDAKIPNATRADKYIKNASSRVKREYLDVINEFCLSSFNLINRRMYSRVDAYRIIGFGKMFIKKGLSNKASVNENIYNSLAYAYYYIGNYDLDFYYNALAAEQFLKMSEEEKKKNITYVESTIKDLMRKTTKNEAHFAKALRIISDYKIPGKALLKAQKGYNKGFESPVFLLAYGDIALQGKSRIDLLKVIELLEPKVESLSQEEKRKLVTYYSYVGSNTAADKLEKELDKLDKKAAKNRKRSRSGGGFPFGLSVATNPANLLWNTFPLAADLRIGGTIHQFRINTHTERTTDRIWGNYSLMDNNENLYKEWKIEKGRDYNYSLLFNAGDNIAAGLQLGYGQFKLASDFATLMNTATQTSNVVSLNPQVNRYTAAMQWGWRFASRRQHYYFAMYYIAGVGYRTMNYGYTGNLAIDNQDQFEFREDQQSHGYRHKNWGKMYGVFNFRMRVGITLF